MSLAKIKGQEYPLQEVFGSHFIYKMPLYQRPDAWGKEQAEELLNDLLDSVGYENNSPIKEANPYFLGSIVLIKEDDIAKPISQVVDGQQRLVTLTILLSVIRDLCNEDIAADLAGFIVQKGSPLLGIQDQYRLTLREEDEKFFREHIQTHGIIEKLANSDPKICKTDSQKNIKYNAELFFNKLKSKSKLENEQLARFIPSQCYMVVVSTPDSDSAYRIFAILNDRGLDLSHADILKSEIIGKIPQDRKKDYAKLWNEAEDQLERDAFKDLFSHIRMIKHPEKLRKDVLKEFREVVVKPSADSKEVIDEIVKYARVYDVIRNEAYESSSGAEEINAKLGWLNKIDNKDWLPPAILYASLNKNPIELSIFLTDLERLAAGLMICRADVNKRIKRYGDILKAIKNDQNLHDETSPLQLTSEERKEIVERLDGDLYLESQFRLYVLLRLDDALSDGGAEHNYRIITIEHVLPQTPAIDQWKEFQDPSIHKKYVHRLGNLVLLTRKMNPKASNYEFDKKKKVYFKGKDGIVSFHLTKQASDEPSWTPDVIEGRQKALLDKLKEIWML